MSSYIRAIAVDYDGTLAETAPADADVVAALRAARQRGLVVVLVTGRILDELCAADPALLEPPDAFDAIVAENGAVLRMHGRDHLLTAPVDEALVADLAAAHVPVRTGQVIIAAKMQDRAAIADAIERQSLDLHLVGNRGELMVLPAGVTKASGLRHALAAAGVDPHNTIAIGDAENDLAMLAAVEVSAAVANAVPSVIRAADLRAAGAAGTGVVQILDGPVVRHGQRVPSRRWRVELGIDDATGEPILLPAAGINLLITGPSGSGKSWVSGMLVEQLVELGYTVLVLDPEGDHGGLGDIAGVSVLSDPGPFPTPAQVAGMLAHGPGSIVIDLSQRSAEREPFLRHLPDLAVACARATGRPHWLVLDEAHAALSALLSGDLLADRSMGHVIVTYEPHRLPSDVRQWLDGELVVTDGDAAIASLRWPIDGPARRVRLRPRATRHTRHWHKYHARSLPWSKGFHFRDGDDHLTGAVAVSFAELCGELAHCASGVLRHHCAHGDFSRWIREVLADPQLAAAVGEAERQVVAEPDEGTAREMLLSALDAPGTPASERGSS